MSGRYYIIVHAVAKHFDVAVVRYFFALLSMFNFVWNVLEFGRDNSVYITFNIINEPRQGQARFTKVKQTNLESVKIVFQVKLPNRRFYSMDILLTKM